MNPLPENIVACLDFLCAKGCKAVRQSIAELEQGKKPNSTENLSTTDCRLLLEELKSIMRVYDKK